MTEGESVDLKIIENRLRTFDNWPVTYINKHDLARAGFFYLNNSDQVKCCECGGIIGQWEEGDIPFIEHRKFFPNCAIVRQSDLLNEEIGIQRVETPKYPEYSTIDSRNRSFLTWTSNVQDTNVLAQAGFYYLGSSDEVRCFYCDGGLRNWLVGDDPWVEHARWFPKCPFVILVKGPAYIKNVLELTKNLNQGITASGPTEPVSIDDAMNSQPAQDALQMGLNAGRVRSVMQRRIQLTGRPFTSTEMLVSAVLDGQIEDEGFEQDPETEGQIESQVTELLLSAVSSVAFNSDENEQQATTSSNSRRTVVPDNIIRKSSNTVAPPKLPSLKSGSNATSENDEKRLKNVECKICMAEEMGVVFLPCGHLLSCVYCAPAISQCPLCREPIRGRVRTFLS